MKKDEDILGLTKSIVKTCHDFLEPYRVAEGKGFKLSDHDPKSTGSLKKRWKNNVKDESLQVLKKGITILTHLQEVMYAQSSYGLLVILQAMDAAGKDGIIKHVLSGINPQGCQVTSFKTPSSTERKHDFLWRCMCAAPERGMMGIFNRSYYEEVLSVKVHPEWLGGTGLPKECLGDHLWKGRYQSICDYEGHLVRNAILPVKLFLHVSKDEQEKRFLKRIDLPEKNWKFSPNDLAERQYWNAYQDAFEDMIRATATKEAPWYIVPADHKWFSRLVALCAIIETMSKMDLHFPEVTKEQRENLQKIRNVIVHPNSKPAQKEKKHLEQVEDTLMGEIPPLDELDDGLIKSTRSKKSSPSTASKKSPSHKKLSPSPKKKSDTTSESQDSALKPSSSTSKNKPTSTSPSRKSKSTIPKKETSPIDISDADRQLQGMPPLKS